MLGSDFKAKVKNQKDEFDQEKRIIIRKKLLGVWVGFWVIASYCLSIWDFFPV